MDLGALCLVYLSTPHLMVFNSIQAKLLTVSLFLYYFNLIVSETDARLQFSLVRAKLRSVNELYLGKICLIFRKRLPL
jgi:hypothetical protein